MIAEKCVYENTLSIFIKKLEALNFAHYKSKKALRQHLNAFEPTLKLTIFKFAPYCFGSPTITVTKFSGLTRRLNASLICAAVTFAIFWL